jgi:endonuclease YncB( thermonuclease family)
MDRALFAPYSKSNTPMFSLNGVNCWGRLVGVHDGDSITVVMNEVTCNDRSFFKYNLRLNGINAPELRSSDPVVRLAAVRSRNRLLEILTAGDVRVADGATGTQIDAALNDAGKVYTVWVKCLENEKYGRTLAEVYAQQGRDVSANTMMLQEGHAVRYLGGSD